MLPFELELCRNYKKKMDMAQTPAGKIAIKLAEKQKTAQENREQILKHYTGQIETPAEPAQKPKNPILDAYKNK